MMGRMEDPLTGYMPSRTAMLEDEERDAQERAKSYTEPPSIKLSAEAEKAAEKNDGILKLQLLVLVTSQESCALLRHTLCSGEVLGSVKLPDPPVNEDDELRRKPSEKRCRLYAADAAELSSGAATVIGICDEFVPPERAFTWARALLRKIEAQLIIVEATMPVTEFRGESLGEEKCQHFVAASEAAEGIEAAKALPRLPTGNLVAGLAAAAMSRLQAEGRKGVLLLNVLPTHLPGKDTLREIADAFKPCLLASGFPESSLAKLADSEALTAASQELYLAWKRSSKAALYL